MRVNCLELVESSTQRHLQFVPSAGAQPTIPLAARERAPVDPLPLMGLIREQINRMYEEASERAAREERQRLARELHDSVAQALYGIGLGAQTALTWLEKDPSRLAEPLQYISALADAGMAEIRALIFDLRPELLEREGLVAAIEKQAAAVRGRYHVAVEVESEAEPDVPLAVKEALMRIAQEAMHNAVKHAGPRSIRVRLDIRPDALELEVADDGNGFDPTGAFPGHLGLTSMAERAERLGGEMRVVSAPGNGTRVRVRVPRPTRVA